MSLSADLSALKRSRLSESNVDVDDLDNIVRSLYNPAELTISDQERFGSTLSTIFDQSSMHWEVNSFCIKILVKLSTRLNKTLLESLAIPVLFNLLENQEPRIRGQACDLISIICKRGDEITHMHDFNSYLLQKLLDNLHRVESTRPAVLGDTPTVALDDTTGWNYLESYLQAVYSMVTRHVSYGSSEPLQTLLVNMMNEDDNCRVCDILIVVISTHINRHIREMMYTFISSYLLAWKNRSTTSILRYDTLYDGKEFQYLFDVIVDALQLGLQDNWSQIRLRAIKATHDTLLCLLSSAHRSSAPEVLERYWSKLLPGLCLNRYYTAEAVSCAALTAWKEVVGVDGKSLIVKHSTSVVQYYVDMCQSGNHMVAEAACASLGEFISKIDHTTVIPHLSSIIEALTLCLNDERWPVKDQACLPTGMLIRFFPVESRDVHQQYVKLWNHNLQDCIWSVRENAALAYTTALRCSDSVVSSTILSSCVTYINEHLLIALTDKPSEIKASMKNFSFLPPSMLTGRPAGYTEDKIASLVTSAAPKKSWGCCVDCVELRQSVPWEITQGALYLIRELSKLLPKELLCKRSLHHSQIELSYIDAIWLLLLTDDVINSEKLHNAIYEEIPSILVCSELSKDLSSLSRALTRDTLTTGESLGDLNANKNAAKYKVNRVAAATTGKLSGSVNTVPLKSSRRQMAEKCIERLFSQNIVDKIVFTNLFDNVAVQEVLQSIVN